MTKHTPLIRLQAARHAYGLAVERCPHWSFDDSDEGGHECCYDVDDARRELRLAKQAMEKAA